MISVGDKVFIAGNEKRSGEVVDIYERHGSKLYVVSFPPGGRLVCHYHLSMRFVFKDKRSRDACVTAQSIYEQQMRLIKKHRTKRPCHILDVKNPSPGDVNFSILSFPTFEVQFALWIFLGIDCVKVLLDLAHKWQQ